jgi:carbon-monoxide dehydrogenase medium subunit
LARRPGDLAIIGVATCLEYDRGLIHRARIAVFGGSEGATRISAAEGALLGSVGSSDDVERASIAAAAIPTHSDVHATAALRSHLATALTRRALSSAVATQRLT